MRPAQPEHISRLRAILSGSVGNLVEWYIAECVDILLLVFLTMQDTRKTWQLNADSLA